MAAANMTAIDTRTLVRQTADTLLSEGIRPTVANVRSRTGRGSAGTINAALQEWWQELAARLAQLERHPEIPQAVFRIADEVWKAALEQAEATLAGEWQKLQDEREACKAQVKKTHQARQMAEQQRLALAERLEDMERTRLILERELAAEKMRTENLAVQASQFRTSLEQKRQAWQAQAARYEDQLAREREQWAGMEQHLVKQLDEQKTLRERQEKLLQQREAQWREQEEKSQGQRQAALTQLAQAREKLKGLEKNWQDSKAEVRLLQQEKEHWVSRVVNLEAEKKQLANEKNQLQSQKTKLKQQLEDLTAKQEKLSQQLQQAEARQAIYEAKSRTLQALVEQWINTPGRGRSSKNPQ